MLQEKLAKAIFLSDSPLQMVENKHWISFWKSLRPGFQPPNRQQISNPLLDKCYEEVSYKVIEEIHNASSVGIITDGWSN